MVDDFTRSRISWSKDEFGRKKIVCIDSNNRLEVMFNFDENTSELYFRNSGVVMLKKDVKNFIKALYEMYKEMKD